jgi:hypothetical protein
MSTLQKVFESIKSTLHWGPSVEPFHQAVINEHDALVDRVAALEYRMDGMFPTRAPGDVKYITDVTTTPSPSQAIMEALAGHVADDAASLIEGAPAAPAESSGTGDKADSDLLAAKPDPVPAGPDASEGPGDPLAENSASPAAPVDDHPASAE